MTTTTMPDRCIHCGHPTTHDPTYGDTHLINNGRGTQLTCPNNTRRIACPPSRGHE